MIEQLTPEQEAQIKVYQKKAFDAAYDTMPGDDSIAEKCIKEIYGWAKLKKPEVVFVDSPMAIQEYLNKRFNEKKYWDFAYYGEGGIEKYWTIFYRFFEKECSVKLKKIDSDNLFVFEQLLENSSFMAQLDGLVVISRKPVKAHRDDRNRPHKDGGKVFEWADGWGFYMLHGVRVPEWLVMTPAEKIILSDIFKESNVEIRHEAVLKIGNDVFYSRLMAEGNGKEIDKQKYYLRETDNKVFLENSEDGLRLQWYTLISFDLNLGEPFVVLKMENPSLPGIWHYENVKPTDKTIEDALETRTGVRGMPEFLT
jgi:hypothetical protein